MRKEGSNVEEGTSVGSKNGTRSGETRRKKRDAARAAKGLKPETKSIRRKRREFLAAKESDRRAGLAARSIGETLQDYQMSRARLKELRRAGRK